MFESIFSQFSAWVRRSHNKREFLICLGNKGIIFKQFKYEQHFFTPWARWAQSTSCEFARARQPRGSNQAGPLRPAQAVQRDQIGSQGHSRTSPRLGSEENGASSVCRDERGAAGVFEEGLPGPVRLLLHEARWFVPPDGRYGPRWRRERWPRHKGLIWLEPDIYRRVKLWVYWFKIWKKIIYI